VTDLAPIRWYRADTHPLFTEARMNTTSAGRRIRKIVVEYEGGGGFELENDGSTDAIDGLVWSDALMDRLRYEDASKPGRCEEPKRETGTGWKKKPVGGGNSGGNNGGGDGDALMAASGDAGCIYVHSTSCTWSMICDT
jgi:hypothetical protein